MQPMTQSSLRLFVFGLTIVAMASGPAALNAIAQRPAVLSARSEQIIGTVAGTWRSATVFTHAAWNDLLFFGGGAGVGGGDPRHEIEIGVLDLKAGRSGSFDPRNPVIARRQFGLDEAGKGITPLSILELAGTLTMFCTSRPNDDLNPRIVVINASMQEPLRWGNYAVVIDESFSGCRNNHGAAVIVDPDDPANVLVYFAACTPPNDYRILLASCPKAHISEQQHYSLLRPYDDPALKRDRGKANYPFVRYDADTRQYELWYSGQTHAGSSTRSCFMARSTSKHSFEPALEPIVNPSGVDGRNDRSYATGPKVYGGDLYYSGRKDPDGDYVGIFRVPLNELP